MSHVHRALARLRMRAAALMCLAGFVTAIGFPLVSNMASRQADTELALHYARTQRLDQVLLALLDAETNRRGFVIAGHSSFAASFRLAARQARESLDSLTALYAGHAAGTHRLKQLRSVVDAKLADLQTLMLSPQGLLAEASTKARIEEGRRQMADARMALQTLRAEEMERLQELSHLEMQRSFYQSLLQAAILLGVALTGALLLRTLARSVEQAQANERWIKGILHHVPDAFVSVDGDGFITEWNPAATSLFGWQRSEAIGQPLSQLLVPPSARAAHEAGFKRFQASGAGPLMSMRVQVPALHRDGHELPVEMSLACFKETGHTTAFAFLHDISGRKAAEARLKTSERTLRDMADSVPALIGRFDTQGRFTFVNAALCNFFGASSEELLGRSLSTLSRPPAKTGMGAQLTRALHGEAVEFELEVPVGETPGFLQVHCVPDFADDGAVQGCYVTALDNTHARRTERLLAESDLALQRQATDRYQATTVLTTGLAHDFNNLLGSIRGLSDVSACLVDPGSRVARNLDLIRSNSSRASAIVRQLLDFASRGVRQQRAPLAIDALVNGVALMLTTVLPKGVHLDVRTPGGLFVMGDAGQLEQVLLNLVTNAGHAMREINGSVRVEATLVAEENSPLKQPAVRLSVVDQGCGIASANLSRVFEAFFTTKAPDAGSGLGLSSVRGIVQAHGGDVTVESTVGVGTRFDVYLPVFDPKLEDRFHGDNLETVVAEAQP